MSITNWQEGEVFTVRTYKYLSARRDIVWANTYEVAAETSAANGATTAAQACQSIMLWESWFHLTDVVYDRAVFSTAVEDGQPYDPTAFISVPATGVEGKRNIPIGNQVAPLQTCLFVRRQVAYGRNGRALYRRCLLAGEVLSPAGDPVISDETRDLLNDILEGQATESFGNPLPSYLLTEHGLRLVMVGPGGSGQNIRNVSALAAAGVSIKKYNNRYFDRVAQ